MSLSGSLSTFQFLVLPSCFNWSSHTHSKHIMLIMQRTRTHSRFFISQRQKGFYKSYSKLVAITGLCFHRTDILQVDFCHYFHLLPSFILFKKKKIPAIFKKNGHFSHVFTAYSFLHNEDSFYFSMEIHSLHAHRFITNTFSH